MLSLCKVSNLQREAGHIRYRNITTTCRRCIQNQSAPGEFLGSFSSSMANVGNWPEIASCLGYSRVHDRENPRSSSGNQQRQAPRNKLSQTGFIGLPWLVVRKKTRPWAFRERPFRIRCSVLALSIYHVLLHTCMRWEYDWPATDMHPRQCIRK